MPEKRSKRKRNKGGRPRKTEKTHVFRVTFTYTEGEDDDMIALFRSMQPYERPRDITSIIRKGGGVQEHIEAAQEEIEAMEESMLESL